MNKVNIGKIEKMLISFNNKTSEPLFFGCKIKNDNKKIEIAEDKVVVKAQGEFHKTVVVGSSSFYTVEFIGDCNTSFSSKIYPQSLQEFDIFNKESGNILYNRTITYVESENTLSYVFEAANRVKEVRIFFKNKRYEPMNFGYKIIKDYDNGIIDENKKIVIMRDNCFSKSIQIDCASYFLVHLSIGDEDLVYDYKVNKNLTLVLDYFKMEKNIHYSRSVKYDNGGNNLCFEWSIL